MSKKIIVIMGLVLFGFINRANADCTLIGTVYTACKPGYYLALITCKACPTDEKTGVQTTSPDRNTGGITTCYVPSGASGKDDKGTWVYVIPQTNKKKECPRRGSGGDTGRGNT